MNLTDEETLKKIEHYATKLYFDKKYLFKNCSVEDIIQEFYLLFLEYPGKTLTEVAFMVLTNHKPRDIEETGVLFSYNFSDFVRTDEKENDDYNSFEERLKSKPTGTPIRTHSLLKKLAFYLYPDRLDYVKLFLDYLYGQSIPSSKARCIREKLFSHTVEVLDFLLENNLISLFRYNSLIALRKNMSRYGAQKKRYVETTSNKRCRDYYERHKEEIRQKMLERYYKKRNIS